MANNDQPGIEPQAPDPAPKSAHPLWRPAIVAALVFGLVALIVITVGWPRRQALYTDADTIKVVAAGLEPRDILWQPPTPLPEVINSPQEDYEPRVSYTGDELYFVRGKAGANADIYRCVREGQTWSEPQPVESINSPDDELGPMPSRDGQALYFYSNREGGVGGYDLWVAHRGASGWQTPLNLGPRINTEFNEYGPALTPDDAWLYFSSNRPQAGDRAPEPQAWPATLREDRYVGDYDIYLAALLEDGPGQARRVAQLSSPEDDGAPAVSPVGDFVYFASNRAGGAGGFDLYRSRRLHGGHTAVESLDGINTPAAELDPAPALGGFAIYFSSNRAASADAADDDFDLYYSMSREVFVEQVVDEARMDWGGLWSALWPNLLWLLLALLGLLVLLALLRPGRHGKLGLLARCLLASVFAHLLLLMLLSLWRVGTALADAWHQGGRVKVHLVSSDRGESLADQIRGGLTAVELPAVTAPELQRTESTARLLEITPRVEHSSAPRIEVSAQQLEREVATREADVGQPGQLEARELERLDTTLPANMPERPPTRVAEQPPVVEPLPVEPASRAAQVPPSRLDSRVAELTPEPLTEPADRVPLERQAAPAHGAHVASASATIPVTRPIDITPLDAPGGPAETPERAHTDEQPLAPAETHVETTRAPLAGGASWVPVSARHVELAPDDRAIAESVLPDPSASPRQAAEAEVPARSAARPVATGLALDVADSSLPTPQDVSPVDVADEPDPATRAAATAVVTPTPQRTGLLPERHVAFAAVDLAPAPTRVQAAPATSWTAPAEASAARSVTVPTTPPILDLVPVEVPPFETSPPATDASTETAQAEPQIHPTLGALRPARPDPAPESLVALTHVELVPSAAPRLEEPLITARPEVRSEPLPMPATPLSAVSIPLPTTDPVGLKLPTETTPPANPYVGRTPEQRQALVEQMGGSNETEAAVARALAWLAAHQSADGRWDASGFDDDCGRCGGTTNIEADMALTGLSLLCFLASDHTHTKRGPYQGVVADGLAWLRTQQGRDGDLRGAETMYSHGIAAIALAEAYGMTRDPGLRDAVERAVAFISRARNTDGEGGWRYDPGQSGDTSVLGWQMMALKSARRAGITVDDGVFDVGRQWLARVMTDTGRFAYRPGRAASPAMTAEAMFTLQLLDVPRSDPRMKQAVQYIMRHLPAWDSESSTYYWYYATLALYQYQGAEWPRWNEAMTRALLERQITEGAARGSWTPGDRWSHVGGRVYQTALCTLMLESYYRYLPMYQLSE